MDAATILGFLQLGVLVGNLIAEGLLEKQKTDTALAAFAAKWAALEATLENIEAARLELLELAGYPNPREDVYIAERLAEIDGQSLA